MSVAVVAGALIAGGCGDKEGPRIMLGPVAAVPSKERVDFGEVPPGESASKTVTVTNDSDEPQTLTALDIEDTRGGRVAISGTCNVGEDLAPKEKCTVVMTITAKGEGENSAVLAIKRSECCRPQTTDTDTTPNTDTDTTPNTDTDTTPNTDTDTTPNTTPGG